MLAGFEKVSSGSIFHGDRCLSNATTHVAPENRDFGMVFQSYALWPHMSVMENIAYPLTIKRVDRATKQKRIQEALAIVQLEPYADRSPAELSGGQRQRVALARSLVTEPEVILLDEPLANLDRHLRATMEETFRTFHKRTGATMVYVTHDQSEAMSLADQIAVLKMGNLSSGHRRNLFISNPEQHGWPILSDAVLSLECNLATSYNQAEKLSNH